MIRSLSLLALLLTPAASMAQVAVPVGGDATADACATLGEVTGLNPRGDGYLSVRDGPDARRYRETDRLRAGRPVMICAERGAWLGVVYPRAGGGDCGVASPLPRATAYRGPCRSGWVHRRYIEVVAG